MGAIAIPLQLIAAAASAGGAIYGGYAKSAEYKGEANAAEAQADTAQAAAAQDEAQRRRQLTQVIASQDALRAARGSSLTSGTALSIYGDTVGQAEQDIRTSRLNYLSQADQYRMTARARRAAATDAVVGGYLSAAGSSASIGATAARS